MNDELTYEKALEEVTGSCAAAFFHEYSKFEEGVLYRNENHICIVVGVASFDYKALKKLEEAIEKAKKYDLLAKEEVEIKKYEKIQ